MDQMLPLEIMEPLKVDYLFDIKFDGESFDGVMEIGKLAAELRSLNFCINEIISAMRLEKRTDIKFEDYDIVVEAFKNNCFKKRIKLVVKKIEKYPVISGAVTAIFIGIINAIPQYHENNKISPEMMHQIEDNLALKLLDSKEFRKGIFDIVAQPLECQSDSMHLMPSPNLNLIPIVVPFDNKNNYIEESVNSRDVEKAIDLVEVTREDSISGRIIAIDLDATKHQVDFKIYGEGKRVNGTLSNGLNINDYKIFLGEFVEIRGLITEVDGVVVAMEIKNIYKSIEPGQISILG